MSGEHTTARWPRVARGGAKGIGIAIALCLAGGQLASLTFYTHWIQHPAHVLPDSRPPRPALLRPVLGGWIVAREGFGLGAAAVLTPFGYVGDPFAIGRRPGAHRPVLLVHGYGRNRSAWYLYGLGLRLNGWTEVYTINLRPAGADLDEFAGQVQRKVDDILAHSPHDRVDLVCHSMGGVVGRAYVQKLGGHARVAHLVTLGSPHHGTYTAPLAPLKNAHAMAPGSSYLAQLNDDPAGLHGVPATAVYTRHDAMVFPATSAALPPPARTIELRGLGHIGLLWSPHVYRIIRATLAETPAIRETPAAAAARGNA